MTSRIFNLRFWTFGGWFTMAWIAVGTAVVGGIASVAGENAQAGAISDAADKNAAAQRDQNNAAWSNYLMTRGIAPTGQVTAGVLPTAGSYNAVNSRLPLWANVTSSNGPQRWVKKGTAAPVQRWILDSLPATQTAGTPGAPAGGAPGNPGSGVVAGITMNGLTPQGYAWPVGPPASFVAPRSLGYG